MNYQQTYKMPYKRCFDFMLSLLGLCLTSWLIVLAWLIASIDTKSNGFFLQKRVGKNGKIFTVIKIKTMIPSKNINTTITQDKDPRITQWGRFFRKTKIDELPQLINVLLGQMSFVGPRPDVPGYADQLQGSNRLILTIRPGITGPATLFYRNEEEILAEQINPTQYNNDVIYPHKVQLNIEYIQNWSFKKDLYYIYKTIFK